MAIREVWASNLEQEFKAIRSLVDQYPYVSVDTEFPGVVARPIGAFRTSSDYHYQTMRCNVDLLRIIQLGLTLADSAGNHPPETTTWQFNFKFAINEDMYAPESIELLQKSGLDFPRHEEQGIPPEEFSELLITSGLVLSDDTKWIGFHSGYDFGYLIKILTAQSLPTTETEFFDNLEIWFPSTFDVKIIMRSCKVLKGGLQDVADDLGISRVGPSHQAGSDSLLTAAIFFKIREQFFQSKFNEGEYTGLLYGLGSMYLNGDTVRAGVTLAERERSLPASREHVGQNQVAAYATPLTSFTPSLHNHYVRQ